ncbi:MAG: polysulfide reductase NrfD [Planctomycetes bacterium]|nr:polysulfide reductase NrfD [Planctomycetota bacterium]
MDEITSTRMNHGIDPALHVWGWEIPVYLYLGGIVAGLMILAGYHILKAGRQQEKVSYPYAPVLGVVLLSLGMGALFLDLAHKVQVWRLYTTFAITSPMSWGSWILQLVYPALIAAAILHPPERVPFGQALLARVRGWSAWLHDRPRLVQTIGLANLGLGIALGIYTGILLGAFGARPLWNSAILGPLFLFSGLSTAAALMHLLAMVQRRGIDDDGYADALLAGVFRLMDPTHCRHIMMRFDASFLTIELAIIALWLIGLVSGSAVQQQAAALILGGAWTAAFWAGVVILGILMPLLLQGLELAGRIRHTVIPAILVLAGGFILRWVLVGAGQATGWN